MDYLPLTQPGWATLRGAAEIRHTDDVFHSAVLLANPGDGVSFRAHGRQLGLVLIEHDWSGTIEVRTPGKRYNVDLYSVTWRTRVFEAPLPPVPFGVPVSIRVTDARNPSSHGGQAWICGAYVTDTPISDVPARLLEHTESPPFTAAGLNELADVFDWYEPDWKAALQALNATPPYAPPDFVHRKAWEWAQTIHGLDWLGMVQPEHRALGLGVGWEPLSFFFSNHFAEVVATDLYAVDDDWTRREGNPRILEDPDSFAPYPYRKDRVRFLRMDGKKLDFPDEHFDVVWSCSSIEHFGGHDGAAQAMREVERVLRPGGVASIITEYVLPNLTTGGHTTFDAEYFNLRCVYDYLVRSVPGLKLVQPIDLSIPSYYTRRIVSLPDEWEAPHGAVVKPHIVLRSPRGTVITSIALFLRKTGGPERAAGPRHFKAEP